MDTKPETQTEVTSLAVVPLPAIEVAVYPPIKTPLHHSRTLSKKHVFHDIDQQEHRAHFSAQPLTRQSKKGIKLYLISGDHQYPFTLWSWAKWITPVDQLKTVLQLSSIIQYYLINKNKSFSLPLIHSSSLYSCFFPGVADLSEGHESRYLCSSQPEGF